MNTSLRGSLAIALMIFSFGLWADGPTDAMSSTENFAPPESPQPAAAAPTLPNSLLNSCQTGSPDQNKSLNAAAQTSRAKKCADQVKDSWNLCGNNLESDNAFNGQLAEIQAQPSNSATGDIMGTYQKSIATDSAWKDRFSTRSASCATEKRNVQKACDAAIQDVRDAITANSKAQQNVTAALNSTSPTDPNRAAYLQQSQQLHEDGLKLQKEYEQTRQARDYGVRAFSAEVNCAANRARIFDDHMNKTQDDLSTISDNGQIHMADATPDTPADPSSGIAEKNAVKGPVKAMAQGVTNQVIADSIAGGDAAIAQSTAVQTFVNSSTNFLSGSIESGVTGSSATTALTTGANAAGASTYGALVGSVGLVGGSLFGVAASATPTARCDGYSPTPLAAYSNSGNVGTAICPQSTAEPQSANTQSAIDTLSRD